jgi:NitT/TauT family transport system ATP-binding protein
MSPRPGRIRHIVPVGLGSAGNRDDGLREASEFFAAVGAVREALHGSPAAEVRGVETR